VTEQAATWIKDDANWKELGTLVDGQGRRLIEADHVVDALKILVRLDVAIRDLAIWNDYDLLQQMTTDPIRREWLKKQ
jgi:hypothetical protein